MKPIEPIKDNQGGVQEPTKKETRKAINKVLSDAITPKPSSSDVFNIDTIIKEPVKPSGPETILNPIVIPDFVNTGIKYVVPVDYQANSDSIVTKFNERNIIERISNSQGQVRGLGEAVRGEIKKDAILAGSKGIKFSATKGYKLTMADLYIDTMSRLQKDVSGFDVTNKRFLNYVISQEGIREIEQGLTVINTYTKFNKDMPDIVNRRLEFPAGRGRLDSKFIGLTNKDYEEMGVLGKIGYNLAVAGSKFSNTVFGESDIGGEIVPDVAPVGEIVGTMAGWIVPFGIVNKAFKSKGILQGAGTLGKFGSMVVREAIAGAIADTYVFESDEGTLGNVFADVDNKLINNALTTALAIDITDSEFTAKAKIALEGVVLGVAMDGVILGLKNLKSGTVTSVAKQLRKAGILKEGEREALSPILKAKIKAKEELRSTLKDQLKRNKDMAIRRIEATDAKIKKDNITDDFEIVKLTEDTKKKGDTLVLFAQKALDNVDRDIKNLKEGVPSPEEIKLAVDNINTTASPIEDVNALRIQERKDALKLKSLEKDIPSKVDLGTRLRRADTKELEGINKISKKVYIGRLEDEILAIGKTKETLTSEDIASITSKLDAQDRVNPAGLSKKEVELVVSNNLGRGDRVSTLGAVIQLVKDVSDGNESVDMLDKFSVDLPNIIDDILSVSEVNDVADIELALQTAAILFKQDSSSENKLRLTLVFDMLEESGFKGRRRSLVPADFTKNKSNLRKLFKGDLSSAEIDKIETSRNRSNKLSIEGVVSFASQLSKGSGNPIIDIGKKGIRKIGRTTKTAASVAVDARTNNILYSLGLPSLAAVGGVLVKSARELELGIGRSIQDLFTRPDNVLAKTYREVNTLDSEIDNILYTLSGGKIQSAGRDLESGDLIKLLSGLVSASAPSRIDPSIALKSETLLGAGLKAGFDSSLGVDPSGLSSLGKAAQGIENGTLRNLITTAVSIMELIPRKGLGAMDEALKTRDIIREFQVRIDNNLKNISIGTALAEVTTTDQKKIGEVIKELFLSNLGAKVEEGADPVDFVESIMQSLKDRTYSKIDVEFDGSIGAKFEKDLVTLSKVKDPSDEVKAALDKAVLFTEDKRILEDNFDEIEKVITKSLYEAQQFAREGTVTQDVPEMMSKLIKGIQSNTLGRAVSPFARSITNIATMTFARTPIAPILLKKERLALAGKLGEIEQARSIGKIALGLGLVSMGAILSNKDTGVRLETVDHGSWREHNIVIPKSASEFEDNVRNSSLRFYHNNLEFINRELYRAGKEPTEQNATDYIMSNLPDWEDKEGSVKINFSRLGPFNTLVEVGMMLHEAGNKTFWDYKTTDEEEKWAGWDLLAQTFDFIGKQGYLSSADDFLKIFSNPDYAAEAYVKGWGTDVINFGKGIFSTAGEPFQKDFRPSRSNSIWSQKRFNQIGSEEPNSLMKRRDFLGRVIDAPDRVGFTLGVKQDLDIIGSELEDLRITKRVSRPNSISGWKGIDLRKFKRTTKLNDADKVDLDTFLSSDGINSYEDWLIMSGSTNVSQGKSDEIKGSATSLLQKYFKSSKYKELKSMVVGIDSSSSQEAIEEAGVSMDFIKKDINKRIQLGYKKATANLWLLSDLYFNKEGESLKDVFNNNQESVRQSTDNVIRAGEAAFQAGEEVKRIKEENKRARGLDALINGGNK